MRKNYVNKNILETIDKHTFQQIVVSISTYGKLYDKKSGNQFDAKRANEIWNTLYEFAKNGKLEVLKDSF